MYKAVIFDLDGTLLDTSRDICRILNETLSRFSLPQITLEQTIRFVGNGAAKLVERATPTISEKEREKVLSDYIARFSASDNSQTRLYPNEAEALTMLARAGVKLAIVTNKPQKAADGAYNALLSMFNFLCVAGADGAPLKPDPTLTLSVVQRLGVRGEECVFVGDGETDIQTARAASLDCISVLWGFRQKEQLQAAGATRFAEDYLSLAKIILN